jgi:hypothetical protein
VSTIFLRIEPWHLNGDILFVALCAAIRFWPLESRNRRVPFQLIELHSVPVMISTRLVELVIDTVVCLTLAKWETVSGQFGGYLSNCCLHSF